MAAVTVNAQREALAATLETIPDTQVSAYPLANPTLPTLQVVGGETDYDESYGLGLCKYVHKIQVMVGLVADIGAHKLMGRYVGVAGNYSVYAKLQADPTLGGVVNHTDVVTVSADQVYTLEGKGMVVGREFTIEILAAGV